MINVNPWWMEVNAAHRIDELRSTAELAHLHAGLARNRPLRLRLGGLLIASGQLLAGPRATEITISGELARQGCA